ncbi:MAG: hypothetical protein RIA64_13515 [Rhodospirillales bacterium]
MTGPSFHFCFRMVRAPLFLGLVLSLGLAGCAGDAPPQTTLPAATQPETAQAATRVDDPQVAALPSLPRVSVAEVLGFSRSDLVAAFGAPAFQRIDKGAEILRFRGEACVLDMFLYKDGENGPARVRYFEARDAAGKNTDRATCVNRTPRTRG